MNPIDLHLVSWNRPKMTELVVRTIHRNTKLGTFRLHVFDNNSEPEAQDMLRRLVDEGLINTMYLAERNFGLEYARNFMLHEMTTSEYFICVDNDCLPEPMVNGLDWVERLVTLMREHEGYAAISCRTQVMIGTGNIFEFADENGDDLVDFPHPGGSLRIMDRAAVLEVNGWDRDAVGRGAEERYIGGKLRDAGYNTAFAAKVRCLHLFGTRGENGTDRWGYDKNLQPADTGHSDIWHPVLQNGDDFEAIKEFAGEENANRYYKA